MTRPSKSARQPRKGGVGRTATTSYTRKTQKALVHTIRNFRSATTFATLTYDPAQVVDGDALRRHYDRLRRYLRKRQIKGIKVIEFCGNGTPHLHLVLDRHIEQGDLAREWHRITGSNDTNHLRYGARTKRIYDRNRLAEYLAKPYQKHIPPGFSVGNFWSSFGNSNVQPFMKITGSVSSLNSLLWTLWDIKSKGRLPRTVGGQFPSRFRVRGGSKVLASILKSFPYVLSG